MKLHKYLFRRFIPIFLGSLGFFALVLVLVDLLMNLTSYMQNEATAKQVAQVMLLYVPKTIWYAMPLGILFAVAYSLSDLYANNELTAIFSSGVSLGCSAWVSSGFGSVGFVSSGFSAASSARALSNLDIVSSFG